MRGIIALSVNCIPRGKLGNETPGFVDLTPHVGQSLNNFIPAGDDMFPRVSPRGTARPIWDARVSLTDAVTTCRRRVAKRSSRLVSDSFERELTPTQLCRDTNGGETKGLVPLARISFAALTLTCESQSRSKNGRPFTQPRLDYWTLRPGVPAGIRDVTEASVGSRSLVLLLRRVGDSTGSY